MNIKNIVLFLSLSICSLGMAFGIKNENDIKQRLEEVTEQFALHAKVYAILLEDCAKKSEEAQASSILGRFYPDLFVYECNVCEDEAETLWYIGNEKKFLEKELAKVKKSNK